MTKEAKEQLDELKWDSWFVMTLGKITRANEDPKGKAARPPPLEIADVSPYVKNPQLSDSINESARKQWEFRESRVKKAREAQAQAAVTLQAEQNQEEAELYRDTLRPSSLEAEEVNAMYGKDLESSLMMAKTGLEMFIKGRTDYTKFDLKFQKDFRRVTAVAVDLVNNMSLADFPQAKAAVLREAGIVPHKCSGQYLCVPHEFGPPTAPLPPTSPPSRHPPLHGSKAAPVEVDPEVAKKTVPPHRTIPKKTVPALTPASSSSSSSSTATALTPASSSSSSSSTAIELTPASSNSNSSTTTVLRPEGSSSSSSSDRDSDHGSSRSSDRNSDRGSSNSSDRGSDRGSSRSNRSSSSSSSDHPARHEGRSSDHSTRHEHRSSDRTTQVGSKRSREREENDGNDNSRHQRVGGKGSGKGKGKSDGKSKGDGKGKGEKPRCRNEAGCELRFDCNYRHTNAEYQKWGQEDAARAIAPPPANAVVAGQAPEAQHPDSEIEVGFSPLPAGDVPYTNVLETMYADVVLNYSYDRSDAQNDDEDGEMEEEENGVQGHWSTR